MAKYTLIFCSNKRFMMFNRDISYNEHPPKKNLENQKILKDTIYTLPEGEGTIRDKLTNQQ